MFVLILYFFSKQRPAYDMRISDWSSDVCSADLHAPPGAGSGAAPAGRALRDAGVPLTVSLLLALGIAIYAMATPANDLAGTLPTEAAAEVPPDHGGMPAGDWRASGRTAFGDRRPPLARIQHAKTRKRGVYGHQVSISVDISCHRK